jgi:starch synthase
MNIIYLSSEVTPFAKTGGLADVAGSLPKDLQQAGVNMHIFMPNHKNIDKNKFNLKMILRKVRLKLGKKTKEVNLFQGYLPDSTVPVYFIDKELYFNRKGLYQENGQDYPDNAERFAFFCLAALECLKILNIKPDIVHCNDWQTSLSIIYLKTIFKNTPFFQNTKTLLTLHNLAYQGLFSKEKINDLFLTENLYSPTKLEFYDKINLLKGGIIYTDLINTVSKTHSQEIQTEKFGCGLDGVLTQRKDSLYGIPNGLDYLTWNPATDQNIAQKYDPDSLNLKAPNKQKLMQLNNFPYQEHTPVISIISRLVPDKGFELILEKLPEILNMDLKFIVLGQGLPKIENQLQKFAEQFPEKLRVHLKHDENLARYIYAGSDIFLIPSKFEPCGLSQMISLKYGTVPIAYPTGGLKDTIIDIDQNYEKGNGYFFQNYTSSDFIKTLQRALHCYHNDKIKWIQAQRNGMFQDLSWTASAKEYIKLYEKLMVNKNVATKSCVKAIA